ncbi:MAG: imidazolonepropionase [Burkholderiaceae bacterium]
MREARAGEAHVGAYGLVDDGAIAVRAGRIAWVGSTSALPREYLDCPVHDLEGRLVTPGLIDCHTHLVFGGQRVAEFELRLQGASYEEIARAGGGIRSTVQATRAADEAGLLRGALRHVDAMLAQGVTTIEIKSGYGLDIDTELRMLRVARAIGVQRPVRVRTTFLGAHALPPEFDGRADAYIDEVCLPALRAAHAQGLADAVDGFCEDIGFSPAQIARVFDEARRLGLPVKLHAEQLSNLRGAALTAAYRGLSADHLEYLDEDGARAMAEAGTVAVLLPGAFYMLRETRLPPIDALRAHRVPIAIATDFNPGSSPVLSLPLAMYMAGTLFRLTPEEALAGATREAARALGLADAGRIAPGLRADLAAWNLERPAELAYWAGQQALHERFFAPAS